MLMEMIHLDRLNLFEHWSLADDTIMEIGKFSVLWGCIEWKYFDNYCKEDKIDQFVNTIKIHADLMSACKDVVNELKLLYENDFSVIVKRLRSGKMSSDIKKCLKPDNVDDLILIKGTLYICYRIRNNLFHGEKCEFLLNRQKDLFEKLNSLLNNLLQLN